MSDVKQYCKKTLWKDTFDGYWDDSGDKKRVARARRRDEKRVIEQQLEE